MYKSEYFEHRGFTAMLKTVDNMLISGAYAEMPNFDVSSFRRLVYGGMEL